MEFLEAPAFTREVYKYLSEDGLRALQGFLAMHPDTGDIMPGTGGFRKIRWSHNGVAKGAGVGSASCISSS